MTGFESRVPQRRQGRGPKGAQAAEHNAAALTQLAASRFPSTQRPAPMHTASVGAIITFSLPLALAHPLAARTRTHACAHTPSEPSPLTPPTHSPPLPQVLGGEAAFVFEAGSEA